MSDGKEAYIKMLFSKWKVLYIKKKITLNITNRWCILHDGITNKEPLNRQEMANATNNAEHTFLALGDNAWQAN